MNTPKTPLVQKLILLMLVLIFGVLVIMLIKGNKQLESLRAGNGEAVSISTNPNEPANVRRAFPSLRSSKTPAKVNVDSTPTNSTPVAVPPPDNDESAVIAQPPKILPTGVVLERTPEALDATPGVWGRVGLFGTPPPEKAIKFDQICGAMHDAPVTTRHFIVHPYNLGLANVFVYISRSFQRMTFNRQTTPVLLDQKDCMYQPYVIGAMVNQPIQIKNSDPILHNVHALPRPGGNDEFNFAQPIQDQVDERRFPKPEVFVKFKCEVHDWMFAYVGVVDNPFFAVTDTNGAFQLPEGLPPGKYEITATHLKAGSATQRFTYKKGTVVHLAFQLRADGKNGNAIALQP